MAALSTSKADVRGLKVALLLSVSLIQKEMKLANEHIYFFFSYFISNIKKLYNLPNNVVLKIE